MTMTNPAFDLFDAFRAAGMPDDKARLAADAMLRGNDPRLDRIEGDVGLVRFDVARLKVDAGLLKWMMGVNNALVLLVLGLLLRMGA